MYISGFGIFWGQTDCCLCHIQMPSSLEVIWSRKNQHIRSNHSNNSFIHRGEICTVYVWNICNINAVYILLTLVAFALLKVQDNNDVLAYWLSNTSTLLLLLQHTLKASGAASLTPQRRRTASSSLFGRMSQVRHYLLYTTICILSGFHIYIFSLLNCLSVLLCKLKGLRASPQSAGLSFLNGRGLSRLDDFRQVEAKYPALLFKQQLTAFLEKIYGMIRDNLKKEISPLLGLCIQVVVKSYSLFLNVMLYHPFLNVVLFQWWDFFLPKIVRPKMLHSIQCRLQGCRGEA